MFNADGMHVLDVARGHRKLVITLETDTDVAGCPSCGVLATGHGRRRVRAADAPCFGIPVLLIWLKRIWRCAEPDCAAQTWSEEHELIGPRALLTSRAIGCGRPTRWLMMTRLCRRWRGIFGSGGTRCGGP